MEQGLALSGPAGEITWLAVPLDLDHVSAHRLPPTDLSPVFVEHSATHVITAIPLEPPARIIWMDPSLLAPDQQGLACLNAEKIELAVASARRELGTDEPAFWKLAAGIGHIPAAEHAEPKHLLRRQIGAKVRIEVPSGRLTQNIGVTALHLVIHCDYGVAHCVDRPRAGDNSSSIKIAAGIFGNGTRALAGDVPLARGLHRLRYGAYERPKGSGRDEASSYTRRAAGMMRSANTG